MKCFHRLATNFTWYFHIFFKFSSNWIELKTRKSCTVCAFEWYSFVYKNMFFSDITKVCVSRREQGIVLCSAWRAINRAFVVMETVIVDINSDGNYTEPSNWTINKKVVIADTCFDALLLLQVVECQGCSRWLHIQCWFSWNGQYILHQQIASSAGHHGRTGRRSGRTGRHSGYCSEHMINAAFL